MIFFGFQINKCILLLLKGRVFQLKAFSEAFLIRALKNPDPKVISRNKVSKWNFESGQQFF